VDMRFVLTNFDLLVLSQGVQWNISVLDTSCFNSASTSYHTSKDLLCSFISQIHFSLTLSLSHQKNDNFFFRVFFEKN
jgi:hypothetical protein